MARPTAKVRFRTNLGSRDAEALGIDHADCCIGSETEVKEAVYEWLASRGIVERLDTPEVKLVPKQPAVAESKPAAIKGSDGDKKASEPEKRKPASKLASTETKRPASAGKSSSK